MNFSFVPLFTVTLILLGVVSNNNSITISATILLLMQQTALVQFVPLVEKHGLNLGIILLTIGVLSPLVSGKAQVPPVAEFLNFKMISAVFIGIFVAWLAGRGVPLMGQQPVLITGLLIGTVIGVAFMGGIPVGPLIAVGILSLSSERVKISFSFRLAIVQRIERMPPKRKIQVRFLLARFDDLHLSVSRVAGSFRYKAFQCWRAFCHLKTFSSCLKTDL